ncbi:hypothetical protein HJFPF1_10201 [Paramyrothecium foliicola]|nr:hypothetical protein HJFPF1_10201 [Paramyrothecium foliicola]
MEPAADQGKVRQVTCPAKEDTAGNEWQVLKSSAGLLVPKRKIVAATPLAESLVEMEPEACMHVIDPDGDVIYDLTVETSSPDAAEASDSADNQTIQTQNPVQAIAFKVSSKHLALASIVFKRMFDGGWAESQPADDGYKHVSGKDLDVEAFLIMMNVIHGRNKKVPWEVSMKTLAGISRIVNYYIMHEAVEVFVKIWIGAIKPPLFHEYSDDHLLWMDICIVFKLKNQFRLVTAGLIWNLPGDADAAKCLLHEDVLAEIIRRRAAAKQQIVDGIRGIKDNLLGGKYTCSYECNAIRLGTLLMELHKSHGDNSFIFHDPPSEWSVSLLAKRLRRIKSPTGRNVGWCSTHGQSCNLSDLIEGVVKRVKSANEGIPLTDIPGPNTTTSLQKSGGFRQRASESLSPDAYTSDHGLEHATLRRLG